MKTEMVRILMLETYTLLVVTHRGELSQHQIKTLTDHLRFVKQGARRVLVQLPGWSAIGEHKGIHPSVVALLSKINVDVRFEGFCSKIDVQSIVKWVERQEIDEVVALPIRSRHSSTGTDRVWEVVKHFEAQNKWPRVITPWVSEHHGNTLEVGKRAKERKL